MQIATTRCYSSAHDQNPTQANVDYYGIVTTFGLSNANGLVNLGFESWVWHDISFFWVFNALT